MRSLKPSSHWSGVERGALVVTGLGRQWSEGLSSVMQHKWVLGSVPQQWLADTMPITLLLLRESASYVPPSVAFPAETPFVEKKSCLVLMGLEVATWFGFI